MELDLIKIDLKIFKTRESLITFCSIHNIDKNKLKAIDVCDILPRRDVRYIIYDIVSNTIFYLIKNNGDRVKIDNTYTENFDFNNIIASSNILKFKSKSLTDLSKSDLESELELCLENEDYDRAIEIRELLK